VATLHKSGKGSLLSKLDMKEACSHIPMHTIDWGLLGFHCMGKFYYPFMFGSNYVPYIVNLVAEALHQIIQRHIPESLCHYLNYFLPIFKLLISPQLANSTIDWIESIRKELGLSFQPQNVIYLLNS